MSINRTRKIMLKITESEERTYIKRLYLDMNSVIAPSLAFIYIVTQFISNLLDEEILTVFVNFEFDWWDTLLSDISTLAMIIWVLADKLLLAIGGATLIILFVLIKTGFVSSSFRRLQEIGKYKKTLKAT